MDPISATDSLPAEDSSKIRRPTIILITPTTDGTNSSQKNPKEKETQPPPPSLSSTKSFKRERRNSFIPVFYLCKLTIKENGQQHHSTSQSQQIEPLLVEKNWEWDDFLLKAGSKINFSNAKRAFTHHGNKQHNKQYFVSFSSIYLLSSF